MSRIVLRWIASVASVASVVLVVFALGSRSGTCVDSTRAAASSCMSRGSGGLLLPALVAVALSALMLSRGYWAQRHAGATR
ncbi:MAG: hypothetical protein ABIU87_02120 [Ornithinibacter sp.]